MHPAVLALKFALELAALGALAWWGATTGPPAVSIALAILAPAAMAVVWGRWAAPRSPDRLPPRPRIALESAVFALAALALAFAGGPAIALAFAAVAAFTQAAILRAES